MARALQAPKKRATAKVARRTTARPGITRTPAVKPARKIRTRTVTDRQRAKSSPVARAVTRKNAPKATRIFVYSAAIIAAVTITLMMVVVVFQTRLAETQLKIDGIEDQISVERSRYDELRLQRSTLREPARLVGEATALGMVPGSKTVFTNVDSSAVAAVLVSMGESDLDQYANTREPLKNYSAVKKSLKAGS